MSERISALMDGELEDDDAFAALAELRERERLDESWSAYHLIGDTLRRISGPVQGVDPGFAARLAQEPTVLAPRRRARSRAVIAWSAAASVAAVALVLVTTLNPFDNDFSGATPLQRDALIAKAGASRFGGNMAPYLLAHQEVSANGSLQGGMPYVVRAAFNAGGDAAP